MPKFSLRQAATASSVSKSTILRAIQSGRLSADRQEDGGYSIDASELFRVYPAPVRNMAMGQSAPEENAHATLPVHEMQIRIAALEAELKAEQRLNSELRGDRDRWHEQAQRLALLPPAAPPAQQQGLFSRVFRKSV